MCNFFFSIFVGRKTAKVKDPNRPKRPTSAYFYFVAKERADCKARGDDCSRVAEWTKVVSAKWREQTTASKKPFEAQAALDKKRYEGEVRIGYIVELLQM